LLTNEIIDLAAASDRLMPHFHIPLQSGSDRILGAMRRRYRQDLYAQRVSRLVGTMPHCAIGVDVITGFPGETDADFQETVDFLDGLPVAYLHVFTYSERENTPAASLHGVVSREERTRRTHALRMLSEKKRAAFARQHEGSVRPVLFEQMTEDGKLTGLTDNYLRVDVIGELGRVGTIVPTMISSYGRERCEGWIEATGPCTIAV
jgi:threonylcarbamoyladenosine tRNA methylthiotransferase MtaB